MADLVCQLTIDYITTGEIRPIQPTLSPCKAVDVKGNVSLCKRFGARTFEMRKGTKIILN